MNSLDWHGGLDYWRAGRHFTHAHRLAVGDSTSEPKHSDPLESAMGKDSALQLGTENNPIVILDSSLANNTLTFDWILGVLQSNLDVVSLASLFTLRGS